MKISLYTLTSAIHDPAVIERNSRDFLEAIAEAAHCGFQVKGDRFDDFAVSGMPVIFVRTGGTESLFRDAFPLIKGTYVRLLTSGMSNSLAASMEILSFLRQQGCQGEILHGSPAYIARRLQEGYQIEQACHMLHGARLGVIGSPSDWLIASTVDREAVRSRLGIEFIDISIDELMDAYRAIRCDSPEWKTLMEQNEVRRFDANAPKALLPYRDGAFRLYLALSQLVERYRLYGFTLRCFDLLTLVHNTGCLSLAMFNARGIPACCEGDIPALLTMVVGQALIGHTGFQANPSRIDTERDEITFAHCTMPMNMVRTYSYDTHFESGIGIGLKGEFEEGAVTIAKISGNLSRFWFCPAQLTANLSERNLCRTQIVLRGKGFADYFLTDPIGNHHVIFKGDCQSVFEHFMQRIQSV